MKIYPVIVIWGKLVAVYTAFNEISTELASLNPFRTVPNEAGTVEEEATFRKSKSMVVPNGMAMVPNRVGLDPVGPQTLREKCRTGPCGLSPPSLPYRQESPDAPGVLSDLWRGLWGL